MPTKNHQSKGMACDYAVNPMIKSAGHLSSRGTAHFFQ